MRSEKIKRLTLTALLTAAAMALSFGESMLPAAGFMPPGGRIGLSNIPVMFSATVLGAVTTFFIVLAKAFFVLITRGFTAFLASLFGGILSSAAMLVIFKRVKSAGCIGAGIISALCHNAGQLAAAFIMTKTPAVLGYAPILLIASVVTGAVTGTIYKTALPIFNKFNSVKECNK